MASAALRVNERGQARQAGRQEEQPAFSLDDKYLREDGTIYLSGIQALVRLLIDRARADRRRGMMTATFVSGYQGSPLAGLDLELSRNQRLLDEFDIHFQPGLNEELAATAVMGSQRASLLPGRRVAGVAGMWYGKAPGLDRASDALRHANFWGTDPRGGALAVVGDDPTAKSSTMPSDSQVALHGFGMPVLYPADVQDVLDLGLYGYELSRESGLWVGLKVVTDVADGAGTALVSPGRIVPRRPGPFENRRSEVYLGKELLETERKLFEGRLEFAKAYARENGLNPQGGSRSAEAGAWLGIVAAGQTYAALGQALRDLGLDEAELKRRGIRLLKLGMVSPLDRTTVIEFAGGLEEIVVLEEKRAFIELLLKDILYGASERPVLVGKVDESGTPLVPSHGELTADDIARIVAKRLGRRIDLPSIGARIAYLDRAAKGPILLQAAPQRTPYFCSGCPHNRSLVVPEGSLVGAGIGCHTMAVLGIQPAFGEIIGMTQMGGEGVQWVGIEPFVETAAQRGADAGPASGHMFQNIGDGTFAHSGSLAIRFAVASGSNITFKVLYNAAVAMTGGQDALGLPSVALMCGSLLAEGVTRIIVTTEDTSRYKRQHLPDGVVLWDRGRLDEAQHILAATPGVTVLIHDQQCAAKKRRLRKRGEAPEADERVVINERVCEGCGDCGRKSNCLSLHPLETEFGRKTQVHQSSCNQDYSCLLGDCPAFVTVSVDGSAKRAAAPAAVPEVELPEPEWKVPAEEYSAYMVGIGGTGVVTVNQILATAAMIEGHSVRSLDQTGLSQKAGPVASHLRFASVGRETPPSPTVGSGEADLLLGFDSLGIVQAASLGKADAARTIAVVSMSEVPTAASIGEPWTRLPAFSRLRAAIEETTRAKENAYVDAELIATELVGDSMAANIVLVGAAYQAGAIPLAHTTIEAAIRLNHVAVEMNLAAFRWGRIAVAERRLVAEALARRRPVTAPVAIRPDATAMVAQAGVEGELQRLLETRVSELISYQDRGYARRYLEFVGRVAGAEAAIVPGHTELSEAVARQLFKLMAYKDEYEVARLHLLVSPDASGRAYWHLHPPLLRALGLRRKLRLGPWFRPALVALRAMKRLRPSPFDPFGHTKLRRTERQLIDDYQQLIGRLLEPLSAENHALIVQVAELAEMIRGYEGVKLASIESYEAALAAALAELEASDSAAAAGGGRTPAPPHAA